MGETSLAADAESLKEWWTSLVEDDPPPDQTRALWFGLFESADGTTFYVQGYAEFEADDETAQWATDEPSWAPEVRYIRLPTLLEARDWEAALGRALRLLEELRPQVTWPGTLDGVAAGFDDGDAHVVWTRH